MRAAALPPYVASRSDLGVHKGHQGFLQLLGRIGLALWPEKLALFGSCGYRSTKGSPP